MTDTNPDDDSRDTTPEQAHTDTDDTPTGVRSEYDDPSEEYASYITVTDSGVRINEPEHRDTTFEIRPETVPERGTAAIDFFYGRPVLYVYEPGREEPQYVIVLPTEDDPHVRTAKRPNSKFNDVLDELRSNRDTNKNE